MITHDAVLAALATVEDPEIHRPITELGMVKGIDISGGSVTVDIFLTIKACPMQNTITSRVEAAVLALEGVSEVQVRLDVMSD